MLNVRHPCFLQQCSCYVEHSTYLPWQVMHMKQRARHADQISEIGHGACLSGRIVNHLHLILAKPMSQMASSWLILSNKICIITGKSGPSLMWPDRYFLQGVLSINAPAVKQN